MNHNLDPALRIGCEPVAAPAKHLGMTALIENEAPGTTGILGGSEVVGTNGFEPTPRDEIVAIYGGTLDNGQKVEPQVSERFAA